MARASRLEPVWFSFPLAIRCESSRLEGWIRSAPFLSSLRSRLQKYIEEELSGARQARTKGHAKPTCQGPARGRGKLAPHQGFLKELVVQDPDIILFKLLELLVDAEGKLCSILQSQICCPGSASLTKKSLVAANIVEKPLNGRGCVDQQNNLPRSLN